MQSAAVPVYKSCRVNTRGDWWACVTSVRLKEGMMGRWWRWRCVEVNTVVPGGEHLCY